MDLTQAEVLSFDCYGTLIDWESGIGSVLERWAGEVEVDLDVEQLLAAYAGNEAAVAREHPGHRYPDVLAEAFRRTGATLRAAVDDAWAERLATSVPDWPAFPDSADALARLARHHRLVILSNVHRDGFAGSNRHLRGDFAAVITAEDVGAYKPADAHFRAFDDQLRAWRIPRDRVVHVAQSLFHDHVPARREGLRSIWINRRQGRPGWGATPEPSGEWSHDLELPSMAALADLDEEQHRRG